MKKRCCICGKPIEGYGNQLSTQPGVAKGKYSKHDFCCDECLRKVKATNNLDNFCEVVE